MEKNTVKRRKRGVMYIRESTEEQDKGFSPANQERTIREYAEKNNIQIISLYKDLKSGKEAEKRNDFIKMIENAKKHEFDVILIFHTSRFARNVEESKHYKEFLRKKLNIDVISVTQQFGTWENPSAALNEGINEVFDEYYSKQLGFLVKTALHEKRLQGYQNGNPPFGYYKKLIKYDKERKKPIYERKWLIHPQESKIVKKIFTLYATGNYSYLDIAEKIQNDNIKTKYGNPFTYSSIKGILSNKVYLGLVVSPRKKELAIIKGKHPAILSKKLFETVQTKVENRRNTYGRPIAQHRFYLLQGIIYCHHCIKYLKKGEERPDAKMVPKMYCETMSWKDKNGIQKEKYFYDCKLKREIRGCNQKKVNCETIDEQIIKLVSQIKLPDEIIQNTLTQINALFNNVKSSKIDKNKVDELINKKKKITFIYTNTDQLTEEQYLKKLKEIDEKLKFFEQIGMTNNQKNASQKEMINKTKEFLLDFKNFWRKETSEKDKRDLILRCIKRTWIRDEKVIGIEPSNDYKPLFSFLKKDIGQVPLATPNGI